MENEPADVLITESVVGELFNHLAEQSRNFGGPADLALLLERAVDRSWGTNKAPRFNDQAGGGWIIDLSDYLDNEMLYAQIRTVHGRRTLTTVVSADEYEEFTKSGNWQSAAAANPNGGLVDPETLKAAQEIEGGEAHSVPGYPDPPPGFPQSQETQTTETAQNPDDPMVILCEKIGSVQGGGPAIIRCKRSEVPVEVQGLLNVKGITEEDIEIWSQVSKPKVTIQF